MSKEEEQEAEGKRVPTPKPEDRESEEEEGKMLKQGDMIEFNTYEELYRICKY
ncbi:MAG: hypothetical protein KatS3mg003_0740 [Candidatus Nitrosocaldaceae archaeon]|nr:MAG: hypothetical protein KatS3mg003_0740 [Candidatus Nitrosocaldaceae archaeon]